MERHKVEYQCNGTTCKGFLVHNEIVREPRPGIIIAHAWKGQDDFARDKAEELARLGFVAFVADIYGEGQTADNDEEAGALMMPFFLDRQLLRDRMQAAYETLKKQELVDKKNIGAIGFCFGGLSVIELLRSGENVKGVVSFHGVLGNQMGDAIATTAPNADKLKGSLLLLHGNDDPLVSDADIKNIQQEFTDAKVDWEMNVYGHAAHAFTNPELKDPSTGTVFNETANDRSWIAMKNFFNEIF
jgi:dienelactone hydrolase